MRNSASGTRMPSFQRPVISRQGSSVPAAGWCQCIPGEADGGEDGLQQGVGEAAGLHRPRGQGGGEGGRGDNSEIIYVIAETG